MLLVDDPGLPSDSGVVAAEATATKRAMKAMRENFMFH